MFQRKHFLCKKVLQNHFPSPRIQPLAIESYFHQNNSSSLSLISRRFLSQIETIPPENLSPLVQCLTESCFLPLERAVSVAQNLKGKTPKDPESVITFFTKDHGFSKTHISKLIYKRPKILFSRLETLRPKMDFFKQMGLSDSDIGDFLSSNPVIFLCNLENKIKPFVSFIHSISANEEMMAKALRANFFMGCSLDKVVLPNVTLLRSHNVPNSQICRLIGAYPRALGMNPDRFREIVEFIKQMGFDPSTFAFVEAFRAMATLRRSKWEAKFGIFKSFGCTDEEIMLAFQRRPLCLTISDEKIREAMNFFMKELGWDPSFFSARPNLLLYSLEKRIKPRHKVLQVLKSKGLLEKELHPVVYFVMSKKKFLQDYVFNYHQKVPGILAIYQREGGLTLPHIGEAKRSKVG